VPTAIAPAGGAATAGKQALVLQSPQGTRIVVQNFQGGQLTPQQLAAIQEQLKTQLMRAQGTKAAASPALAPAPAKTTANAKGKAAPAPTGNLFSSSVALESFKMAEILIYGVSSFLLQKRVRRRKRRRRRPTVRKNPTSSW